MTHRNEQVGYTTVQMDWIDRGVLLARDVKWMTLASIAGCACDELEPFDEQPIVVDPRTQIVDAHNAWTILNGDFALACHGCESSLPEAEFPALFALLRASLVDTSADSETGAAGQ